MASSLRLASNCCPRSIGCLSMSMLLPSLRLCLRVSAIGRRASMRPGASSSFSTCPSCNWRSTVCGKWLCRLPSTNRFDFCQGGTILSEYTEVEQPFLHQLQALGWDIIDQGQEIPSDPTRSLRANFRQWLLPEVFERAVSRLNLAAGGDTWLTDKQLQDLQEQILRQPNRTLLEANEAVQRLLFKAQVDVNEATGEPDPVVRLIDFANPESNHFLAINQFRIDTPGCVKQFIIPDIVLFVNGIPLAVVECKKGGPTCANPMAEAFEQLQRYMNRRQATAQQGLKEGEP